MHKYTLSTYLRGVKHHHVPALVRTVALANLLHRQLVPDQEGGVHGEGRDVPGLDDEGPDGEGHEEGGGKPVMCV